MSLDRGPRPECRHVGCWEGGHNVCQVQPIPTSMDEPGYWEEKQREEAQMYREESQRDRERTGGMLPRRET